MLVDSKTIDVFKNSAKKMLQNSKLMGIVGSGIKNGVKSTKSVSQDNERQDVKPLEEMKATDCGVLISNITKTQDTEKYERIYNDLDDKSKEKFDNLSQKDKDVISTIFKNSIRSVCSSVVIIDSSDDDLSFNKKISEAQNYVKNRNNTILNNLIEIFTNDAYSDLKSYYRKNASNEYLNVEILKNCQVSDIHNYISKTNLSVEDFFKKDSNFKRIMLEIKKTNFENEEIKNQVKENLYELANNENLKKKSLSEQDIASIIEFLTNKNEIMEKMEILNQLKIFDKHDYSYSGYNVKDKLEVFNTLVKLIPENESFLDYEDKIIDCVNTSAKDSYDARKFLENVLKSNIATIIKHFLIEW